MEELYDQFIAMLDANYLPTFIGLLAGLFGARFVPFLKGFAAKTPSKLDDMLVAALEACMAKKQEGFEAITAEQLNKYLTTPTIVELVKLRKAQIAALKAQG